MNLLFDTYFWLVSTGRDIRTVLPSITSVLSNLHNNPRADLRNFFCSPRCQKGWTALIYFIQVCKKLSRSSVRFEVLSFSSFVCRGTFLVPCVQFWMQAKWTFLRIELNFFPKRFSLLWCNVQREKKSSFHIGRLPLPWPSQHLSAVLGLFFTRNLPSLNTWVYYTRGVQYV